MQDRQVAYKIRIGDLLKGEYVEQEGWQPNYVKIGEKQVSRINIIATVVDKQIGASMGTITVDDGSGNIQVRAFNEEGMKLDNINVGDIVVIIGRPRRYGNQFYISYEIVKKLDPLWAKVRQMELGENNTNGTISKESVVEEKIDDETEMRKKILELIRNFDNGDGAEIEGLIMSSGFLRDRAEHILEELIKAGEIYENVAGKVKML